MSLWGSSDTALDLESMTLRKALSELFSGRQRRKSSTQVPLQNIGTRQVHTVVVSIMIVIGWDGVEFPFWVTAKTYLPMISIPDFSGSEIPGLSGRPTIHFHACSDWSSTCSPPN